MSDRISRMHGQCLRVFRQELNYSRSSENWPAVNCLPAGSLGGKADKPRQFEAIGRNMTFGDGARGGAEMAVEA